MKLVLFLAAIQQNLPQGGRIRLPIFQFGAAQSDFLSQYLSDRGVRREVIITAIHDPLSEHEIRHL